MLNTSADAGSEPGVYRFRAMGTDFELLAHPRPATSVLRRVECRVLALERIFSRFRPESELSRLNRAAGARVTVSGEMYEVLHLALAARRYSDGIFEPAILPALAAAGYGRSLDAEPAPTPADRAPARLATGIDLDPHRRRVRLHPGVRIDLGGIVKGWCADTLIAELGPNSVLNAGGDLRATGPGEDGTGWPVAIEDPLAPGRDALMVTLRDEAAATSGTNRRHWGNGLHHLIDPRTRRPADTDVIAATVIAGDCVTAEVAAKAAVILGSRSGARFLEDRTLDGVLFRHDGYRLLTAGMAGRLL